jgi:hypothetical protein
MGEEESDSAEMERTSWRAEGEKEEKALQTGGLRSETLEQQHQTIPLSVMLVTRFPSHQTRWDKQYSWPLWPV